jgi:hypothetical protein
MTVARYLLSIVAAIGLVFNLPANHSENHMKKSVTFLHLLRNTPFFTRLHTEQLKWVIAHSTEWEVEAGTEVSNRLDASEYIWVLLDGGWQVEQGGQVFKAGHADPAKWYGGPQAALLPADSRLIANQHSFVMRIRSADFDDMLKQHFDFEEHLRAGEAFYGTH